MQLNEMLSTSISFCCILLNNSNHYPNDKHTSSMTVLLTSSTAYSATDGKVKNQLTDTQYLAA